MIKYQLICEKEHEFEGWFQSSDAFVEQCAAGILSCPFCETVNVRRALMAPNLASPKTRKSQITAEATAEATVEATVEATGEVTAEASTGAGPASPPPVSVSGSGMPPEAMVKMCELVVEMRNLQAKIKENCRDVGGDFAEEARKIHYGEAEPEGIYGEVSETEREQLDEEGIEIMQMPWLPQDN
jgi:hypothetical protein